MKNNKGAKPKARVVIVGAGFGGMAVARKLRNNRHLNITLINDQTAFRYSPALYRAASGYRRRQAVIPLKELTTDYKNLRLLKAKVLAIDRQKKLITTTDGTKIRYDYAVLSLGAVVNYFGIPGLERYSYSIKTARELDSFHAHLHSDLAHNHKPDRNYVVVGAGPTGSELSAGLVVYLKKIIKKHGLSNKMLKIEVIERADRVLPSMHPKASKVATKRLRSVGVRLLLGEAVIHETPGTLKLADRSIPTHTVVWTAGTANNPFFKSNAKQFEINQRGKVVVNDRLEADERLHIIGDNIEGYHSGLAQSAVRHGHYVGRLIKQKVQGKKSKPFKDTEPTYVVPIGKNWAVMQKGQRVYWGHWVYGLRSLADLIGYADIMGWRRAFSLWLKGDEAEETCRVCKQPSQMQFED